MPLVRKRRAETQPTGSPAPQRARSSSPAVATGREPDDARSDAGDDDGGDGVDGEFSHAPEEQMVKKLVRLALASEHARQPIRRADISAKVLAPEASRSFKSMFAAAQKQLRDVFGMELVELPAKERVTIQQKRAAQRAGGTSTNVTSGTQGTQGASQNRAWVLVSTLPEHMRAMEILPPPRLPTVQAEAAYVGLCTFIVGVIYLSEGQRVSERKLESHLKTCNVGDTVLAHEKTDVVLKRMERQGYVVKIKERDGAGGEETVDYVVGPRGKVEIGEAGVAGMVREVYGKTDTEMEELEDRLETSLGKNTFRRKTRQPNGDAEAQGEEGEDGRNGDDAQPETSRAAARGGNPAQRNGGRKDVQYGRRSTRNRPASEEEDEEGEEEEEEDGSGEDTGEDD